MTWFYNSYTGGYANESPPAPQYFILEFDLHTGQGLHAYGTQAEMLAAVKANGWPAAVPMSGSAPAVPSAAQAPAVAQHAAGSITNDIIGNVNAQSVILRVGEVILGIVLIGIGLAKITGADNFISTAVKRLPV